MQRVVVHEDPELSPCGGDDFLVAGSGPFSFVVQIPPHFFLHLYIAGANGLDIAADGPARDAQLLGELGNVDCAVAPQEGEFDNDATLVAFGKLVHGSQLR